MAGIQLGTPEQAHGPAAPPRGKWQACQAAGGRQKPVILICVSDESIRQGLTAEIMGVTGRTARETAQCSQLMILAALRR